MFVGLPLSATLKVTEVAAPGVLGVPETVEPVKIIPEGKDPDDTEQVTVAGSSLTEFDKSNELIGEFSVKVAGIPVIEANHETLLPPPPPSLTIGKLTVKFDEPVLSVAVNTTVVSNAVVAEGVPEIIPADVTLKPNDDKLASPV